MTSSWPPSAPSTPIGPGWHRLHPLSPVVRAGRGLAVLLIALVLPSVRRGRPDYGELVIDGAVVVVLLVLGFVSWLVTRWQVVGGVLRLETGLLRRSSQRYPLAQVQAIDVVATGLARVLGLAELRLRMAGAASRGGGRLSCLRARDAEILRVRLLASAHGQEAAATPTTEEVLLRVPLPRLLASVLLSGLGAVVVAVIAGLIVAAVLAPAAAVGAIGGGSALVIGLVSGVYRRVNGEYGMTVALAPDGFRLRSGLVETSTETIPVDRIQAVRMIEPVLWRPWGWCRVEVEVAGKRVREENAGTGRERRALLPVGSRALADRVLAQVVAGAPAPDRRVPGRVRWRALLSYRWLAFGRNDRYVTTSGGRLRRVQHWVPLAKVQSIRRVQGPLQRAMNLGSIHLDTAGRSLHAVIKDREWGEVEQEMALLVELCRVARQPEFRNRGHRGC